MICTQEILYTLERKADNTMKITKECRTCFEETELIYLVPCRSCKKVQCCYHCWQQWWLSKPTTTCIQCTYAFSYQDTYWMMLLADPHFIHSKVWRLHRGKQLHPSLQDPSTYNIESTQAFFEEEKEKIKQELTEVHSEFKTVLEMIHRCLEGCATPTAVRTMISAYKDEFVPMSTRLSSLLNRRQFVTSALNLMLEMTTTGEDSFACPANWCSGRISKATGFCDSCSLKSCKTCQELIRGPSSRHECIAENVSSVNLKKNLVKCPSCLAPTVKEEGCRHVVCSVCHTSFDYLTNKKLGTGKKHITLRTQNTSWTDKMFPSDVKLRDLHRAHFTKQISEEDYVLALEQNNRQNMYTQVVCDYLDHNRKLLALEDFNCFSRRQSKIFGFDKILVLDDETAQFKVLPLTVVGILPDSPTSTCKIHG